MFPQSLFYVLVTFCPHEIISLVPVPVYAALVVTFNMSLLPTVTPATNDTTYNCTTGGMKSAIGASGG